MRSKNNCRLFMALLMAIVSVPLWAQTQTITGTVYDEAGVTLPGAAVIIEGTKTGVSTDIDGNFSIEVKTGDILSISCFGYQTKNIEVSNFKHINVSLDVDTQTIEESVVVGYGQQKKASVVGAISVVSTDQLKQSPTANVTNALAGKLPGLVTIQTSGEPGADISNLYIRGISTFSGSQSPLVLVDGVERDFKNMNVQEIESISILKDASATAVYGVRGANGVVLVTTKRGKEGKPTVSLNFDAGFQTPTRMFEMVNAYEMATLTNEYQVGNGNNPVYSYEELEAYRTGSNPYIYPDIDWADAILKKMAPQQQYNLAISGGTEKAKYYVMIGILNQKGLYKYENYNDDFNTGLDYQKYNFRTNTDFKINKVLSAKLNLAGVLGMKHEPKWGAGGVDGVFERMRIANPHRAPIKNPDGSWGTEEKRNFNPLAEMLDGGYRDTKETAIMATIGLKADLSMVLKGLSANIDYSFDFNNSYTQSRTRDNAYYQFNEDGTYTELFQASKLGFGDGLNYYNTRWNFEPSISYSNVFDEDHEVTGLILYNASEYVQKSGSSLGRLPYRRMGVVGRVTYAYKGKYLAEFNAGYNGSENFAEGHRFGFFPAGSVGWVISKENFWASDRFFTYLKLRGSAGLVGNDQIGGDRFLYMSLYQDTGGNTVGYPNKVGTGGLQEMRIGNENLTWEKAMKYNVGFDSKFFSDQLSLTADFFYEKRKDILTTIGTVPTIFGFSSIVTNDGVVSNRGLEVEALWHGKIGKDFYFDIGGNFSFARNRIEEIPEAPQKYPWKYQKGNRVGQPFGRIAEGLFQSEEEILAAPNHLTTVKPGDIRYADLNGDGVIDDNDSCPIGFASVPEIFFGATIGFQWKGLDLTCLFQGAGNSSYNFYTHYNIPFINENNTPLKVWMDRWTPENRDAKYPRVAESVNNRATSTFWFIDNNYLRLKNVELGYTLPQKYAEKIGLENLRFYINGVNLLTWDNIKVYDPENYVNGAGGSYPMMMVVNIGANITF